MICQKYGNKSFLLERKNYVYADSLILHSCLLTCQTLAADKSNVAGLHIFFYFYFFCIIYPLQNNEIVTGNGAFPYKEAYVACKTTTMSPETRMQNKIK
jgi:hypothetical protein